MNFVTIKKYDVANGPGVRVSLFVSGCTHHCKGCFNSEAWDFEYGNPFTEDTINEILEALKPEYINGLSLLGGEPFEPQNQKALLPLLRKVKEQFPEKSIWAYSGYLYDKDILHKQCVSNPETKELISYIDTLVDGKFIMDLKDPKLIFRGSSNQRIINVKESLKQDKIVFHEKN